jgi:hypothetical protein
VRPAAPLPSRAAIFCGALSAHFSDIPTPAAAIFRARSPSLVGGSALFGVGLMTLEPKVLVFVAAMLIGMVVTVVWRDKMRPTNAVRQSSRG